MARSTILLRLRKGLSAIGLICAATSALAQAPAQEAPKNLQVLPKDWTRPQVVAVMQNIDAARAQYNDLKMRYYGAQAYDFSESGLIATAQPLTQTRTDEAIKFLNMNLELFPRSARTYVALAGAQQVKKDKAGAIASLEKALQIEPNNAAAKRTLDQLRAAP